MRLMLSLALFLVVAACGKDDQVADKAATKPKPNAPPAKAKVESAAPAPRVTCPDGTEPKRGETTVGFVEEYCVRPDGVRHGPAKEWYPELGTLKSESTYVEGKREGMRTTFQQNGAKDLEVNYVGGFEDGVRTAWYDNGKKWSEVTMKAGEKVGEQTNWDEAGNIVTVTVHKDTGGYVKTIHYEDGKPVRETK